MSDDDQVARLEELVRDERARRFHAERALARETERVEIWKARAEKRAEALRRKRGLRAWFRRRRRAPGATPASSASAAPIPTPPDQPGWVCQPTLRIGSWDGPGWLREAGDLADLRSGRIDLAAVDVVFAGAIGALPVLEDWLGWEARPPLVLWEPTASDLKEWVPRLTSGDLVVGAKGPVGPAGTIPSFPVATYSAYSGGNGDGGFVDVLPDTPLQKVVERAASGQAQRWARRGEHSDDFADLVADPPASNADKWVLKGRLAAQSRFGAGRALERIARAADLALPPWKPEVGVLLTTNNPDRLPLALDRLSRIRYRPVHVILGLHGFRPDGRVERLAEQWEGDRSLAVRTFDSRTSLGECLNEGAAMTSSPLLAKFDDDDLYGPWYLDEAVDELSRWKVDLVGKASQFVHLVESRQVVLFQPGRENVAVGYVNGPTFVMRRSTWENVRFPHRRGRVDSIFVRGLKAIGGSIRSSSRFEFVLVRHGSRHTWQTSDERFLARGEVVSRGSGLSEPWLDD